METDTTASNCRHKYYHTDRYLYPNTDRNPAAQPTSNAPQGWMAMSATEPTATPPAKV